jgi:hypothetical protein
MKVKPAIQKTAEEKFFAPSKPLRSTSCFVLHHISSTGDHQQHWPTFSSKGMNCRVCLHVRIEPASQNSGNVTWRDVGLCVLRRLKTYTQQITECRYAHCILLCLQINTRLILRAMYKWRCYNTCFHWRRLNTQGHKSAYFSYKDRRSSATKWYISLLDDLVCII